jgi:hypothetical protein
VAVNYSKLLGVIETAESQVDFNWYHPEDHFEKYINVDPNQATIIISNINATRTLIQEEIIVKGRYIMGSVSALRFEIRDNDSGERYSGTVGESAAGDIKDHFLGRLCEATIQPEFVINPTTGDEQTRYTLLGLKAFV